MCFLPGCLRIETRAKCCGLQDALQADFGKSEADQIESLLLGVRGRYASTSVEDWIGEESCCGIVEEGSRSCRGVIIELSAGTDSTVTWPTLGFSRHQSGPARELCNLCLKKPSLLVPWSQFHCTSERSLRTVDLIELPQSSAARCMHQVIAIEL